MATKIKIQLFSTFIQRSRGDKFILKLKFPMSVISDYF